METADIFTEINHSIQKMQKRGGGLTVGLSNIRPKYLVHHMYPLVYERYGLIRNRGPQLVGTFALKGFMTAEDVENPSTVYAFSVVDSGEAMYGCRANERLVNQVLDELGLPYSVRATQE